MGERNWGSVVLLRTEVLPTDPTPQLGLTNQPPPADVWVLLFPHLGWSVSSKVLCKS